MNIKFNSAKDAIAILQILIPFTEKSREHNLHRIHVFADQNSRAVLEATDGTRLHIISLPPGFVDLPNGFPQHYAIADPKTALKIAKINPKDSCEIPCVQISSSDFPDTAQIIPKLDDPTRVGAHTIVALDPAYLEDLGAAYRIALRWSGGSETNGVTIQCADPRDPIYCPQVEFCNGARMRHVLMPMALSDSLKQTSEHLASQITRSTIGEGL